MLFFTLLLFLYFNNACSKLWSKGIVHYSINTKDYDLHSQDVIISTLQKIQNEICLKFFNIPVNYTGEEGESVLYIQNPDKVKTCTPQNYDFSKSVIDMAVGYRCITEREISKLVVDMLKATIHKSDTTINSDDLMKKFQEKNENPESVSLLSSNDRNYINAHYFQECGGLTQRSAPSRRQGGDMDTEFTESNREYYNSKVWPLGIVVYKIKDNLRNSDDFSRVLAAMRAIELETCVMFQPAGEDGVLDPKNVIEFDEDGADWPLLGFQPGVQRLKLSAIARCADPGHAANAVMKLMRVLGFPMMSNRFDRDNYLKINWKNVQKGQELYLEKAPEAAWLKHIPYDFSSATHAPANFLCPGCLTIYTVEPVQDRLWNRLLTMGRSTRLSADDVKLVSAVYTEQCQARVMPMPDEPKKLKEPTDDDPKNLKDKIIKKLDSKRYQEMVDDKGESHLVDLWLLQSDQHEITDYKPDKHNVYLLFTRDNLDVGQPLLFENETLVKQSNFKAERRTVVLLHGWTCDATSAINTVLVPAFLKAENLNVIVVDWSAGSKVKYAPAVTNAVRSGKSVGRFINWLNKLTGSTAAKYHIVGHSLGGHMAGVVGRTIRGTVPYITALDPALPGWLRNEDKLKADDSAYTEVIHTNAGALGYVGSLGHVDFYPNGGGRKMPGCGPNHSCSHGRCYLYLAESLTKGGFEGYKCSSYAKVVIGKCSPEAGKLRMGGLVPKTGSSGLYYLKTNADPPYSQ